MVVSEAASCVIESLTDVTVPMSPPPGVDWPDAALPLPPLPPPTEEQLRSEGGGGPGSPGALELCRAYLARVRLMEWEVLAHP